MTSMHTCDPSSPSRCRRAEVVELLRIHQFVHQGIGRLLEGDGWPHQSSVTRCGRGDVHKAPHDGWDLGELDWSQKLYRTSVGWGALRGSSADAP